MRIRTIKPEFWTHEVLCTRCDDTARLLAIGLLNYADDEGYFLAAPSLVRASLRPFDDESTTTRRALETLQKVGWIRLGKDHEGRDIGIVVNFAKHQKIDRPKPSILKCLCRLDDESTKDRRIFGEDSLLEWNREQGKGREEEPPSIPPVGGGTPVSEASSCQQAAACEANHPLPQPDPVREKKKRGGAALEFPPDFPEEMRPPLREWAADKLRRRQGYTPGGWAKLLARIQCLPITAAELKAGVDESIERGWGGILGVHFQRDNLRAHQPGFLGQKKEGGAAAPQRRIEEPAWFWRTDYAALFGEQPRDEWCHLPASVRAELREFHADKMKEGTGNE